MAGIRIFYEVIKSVSVANMLKLLLVALRNPHFALLTMVATIKTFAIAEREFPHTHNKDSYGNAFRHALWACLILMYCSKVSSPKKALRWCKKITDLHEEIFINEAPQTAMDLHNNQVGMNYFMSLLPTIHRQFFETSFFIEELRRKTKTAKVYGVEEYSADELIILEK